MNRCIYMDNAATTPVDPKVREELLPYFSEEYGNPSGLYSKGKDAKDAVERARAQVATAINANPLEIVFTSGGTESDNLAITGLYRSYGGVKKHIITTAIEHHAVLHTVQSLQSEGPDVTFLPVDNNGVVSIDEVRAAIREDTLLVSCMFANNEMGALQPILEIGGECKKRGVLFHTDAVQAVGSEVIDVQAMNIDALSLSAHKLYGPKGIGALYLRSGLKVQPIIHGGGQERNQRSGTLNVSGIVGLGKAIELCYDNFDEHNYRIRSIRDALIEKIERIVPDAKLTGPRKARLPGNASFTIEGLEGEALLIRLDMHGICASSGSACTVESEEPSHVLKAMGISDSIAWGALRLTVGRFNSMDEVDYVVDVLQRNVESIQSRHPRFSRR